MSKSVRLKDHLASEIERLAAEEKRSLAAMVEILLEQALRLPEWTGLSEGDRGVEMHPADAREASTVSPSESSDDHFRPDFKKGKR